MKTLRLFSRPECHLCDELAIALEPVIRGRARLEIVNIDDDLTLKKRYGLRIPVLVGDEQELSAYPLDAVAVEAFLASDHG
ncbi:MAG: glutaredoxin family protein [Gammaproteobacteria bacterium]|jgi:hypothetical protein|nr:glutaredoxin family protein [Gammaproteobacteria bacterium]